MKSLKTNTHLLLALCLLTGCAGSFITHIPAVTSVTGLDFTPFSDRGFLFTPHMYEGEYSSIGLIKVVITPELERVKEKNRRGQMEYTPWRVKLVPFQDALEDAYQHALSMGADAMVDFEFRVMILEGRSNS